MLSISQFLSRFPSCPVGRFTFVAASTPRIFSRLIPYLFKAVGFSSTRTAGSEEPPMNTCPTPLTCDSFCCRMVVAASYICAVPIESEVRAMMRMGASEGLTLR